ncbi:carboxyvinyl-carboxyphosphonate phosphorylmutase [Secundilactobacillus paracollinoides]|uniref:Carboxyvinyl-carboxyphosphonate phosphorylmutase n=1 Tax=Secundilactobacillus paracollinoides TaxID=240427 RepID=A0A1B2J267_9LACO|nr:carboxyvinyl-carboxyphosphonate phosphorylmutase [Secundilactobacillus paracollinoides]ANZ65462.1 carboxyvinyl-carboxyphosphonate phosphorylmutase [Secundilactobacillus paracollinoides]ANZ68405.1 carboxyvinyl-carboxyphosphonate phosphorylmutase [Secundilactobacillus paracollinoides]
MKNDQMRHTFKTAVMSGHIVRMMVAPDALAAKIAEDSGAQAIFSAGYATSASTLAMPDRGISDFGIALNRCREIINATTIPVFADADTGYGDLDNVRRTVESYEAIGAAGIFIEDQVWPKRCGHMDGKKVEPTEVLEAKIAAAKAARKHDDFLIMSRTDARAVYGLDNAIERSRRYKAAGADLIFIEAPRSIDELQQIHDAFPDTPLMANMIEGGKTPLTRSEDLEKLGFNIVVHPTAMTYTQAYAEEQLIQTLQREGTTKSFEDRMITFTKFNDFVGLDKVNARDAAYAPEKMAQYMTD